MLKEDSQEQIKLCLSCKAAVCNVKDPLCTLSKNENKHKYMRDYYKKNKPRYKEYYKLWCKKKKEEKNNGF